MADLLGYVLNLSFHLLTLSAVAWAIYMSLTYVPGNYVRRVRSQVRDKAGKLKPVFDLFNKDSKFRNHINKMNYMVSKNYDKDRDYYKFVAKTVSVFVVVSVSLLLTVKQMPTDFVVGDPFSNMTDSENQTTTEANVNPVFPILAALVLSSVPYLRLRYKYGVARVASSYELLEVVRLMAAETHLSVSAALVYVNSQIKDSSYIKKPLKNLSQVFVSYADEKELASGCKEFSDAIGTVFAVTFVSLLLYAEKEGRDGLEESLFSLADEMERQRMAILDAKTSNKDAINLGHYGNLFVYVITSLSMVAFLGPSVFFNLQFKTDFGLTGFTISFLLIAVSYVISKLLDRLRLDYY